MKLISEFVESEQFTKSVLSKKYYHAFSCSILR